jgi:hypothetical protein
MNPPMLRAARDVHAAAVGPDLVVLDLAGSDYLCFPGLAGALAGTGLGQPQPDAADELVESGLFEWAEDPAPPALDPPELRRTSRDASAGRGGPREAAQFLAAIFHGRRAFRRHGLTALLTGTPPSEARSHDREALARRAVLFDRWLPWIPGQGLCLWRAYVLRRFLRAGGLDADWVFGVRTCPFSAHCWLQAGDLLLDDDLDRVRLYTPLLVA